MSASSPSPEICILKADGINCDEELAFAFESAGARPQTVHINQLRSGEKSLSDFAGLGLAGGFSYGDDIAAGAVLANEMTTHLAEDLRDFTEDGRPIIGICNGFQVLVRSGLLPNQTLGSQQASLADNEVGHFVCKWLELEVDPENRCVFTPPEDFEDAIPMQIAHGEGRLIMPDAHELFDYGQVVFNYRENPNGSVGDIAGLCDPSGTILGMMPHPERSVSALHPDRSRTDAARSAATIIFKNFTDYAKGL